MSHDNFENDLSSLYKQRKSQFVAPKIHFTAKQKPAKYSLLKLLCFGFLGGGMSFTIMAIISHLADAPTSKTQIRQEQPSVTVLEVTKNMASTESLPVLLPLPPKPEKTNITPPKASREEPIVDHLINPSASQSPKITVEVKAVSVPSLSKPNKQLNAIYKVLPEFPTHSKITKKTGQVTLRYQVNIDGSVNNIKIISSNLDRDLQRLAKKALQQWRFEPGLPHSITRQVMFKFAPVSN
jgi:protein TonB